MKTIANQNTADFKLFTNLNKTKIARVRKWIKALRSGAYEQGTSALCTAKPGLGETTWSYCCLGVANKVLKLNEPGNDFLFETHSKLGLKYQNGEFIGRADDDSSTTALSCLNDSYQWTFTDIAQLLEDQLTVVTSQS